MSTVRFIVSYIVLFIICMLPMALLGQPVLALLLLLMMHARLSVTMGWPAYLLGGALSFLSVAYLTKSPMCGLWFTVALIVPIWVGFLFTASPVKFRFSESMCGTAAAFLIPFSLWEMSFIRLSGTSIHQMLVKSEETALRYFGEGYGTSDLEFARAVIDKDVMPLVEGVIPGVFTVVSFIAAYIVLVGISQAMRYAMQEVSAPAPLFCDLKMPRVPAVFWLCALILVFVPNLNTRILGLNLLLILSFMAAIAGVSMADFYFRRVVKSNFIRWIVYVFALEMTSFAVLIPSLMVGLVDAFMNFRKLKES